MILLSEHTDLTFNLREESLAKVVGAHLLVNHGLQSVLVELHTSETERA